MNSLKLVIRPVRLSDAFQVRENCFSMNTLGEVESQIQSNLELASQGKVAQLVAEVDGMAVGIVSLIRQSHPLHAHRAEVAGLVVHPDYQRRGIARQLVIACRQQAQSMGIQILEISCRGGEPAEQIYSKLGFHEYGRLPRGIIEPWGEKKVFDEVYFFQPVGVDDERELNVGEP